MSDKYILDSEGKPIAEDALLAWARWFEKAERHVALETINGVTISTVFLGIEHGLSRDGKPQLWETMTFTKRKGNYKFLNQWFCVRYDNVEDATSYHKLICECIKRKALTAMKISI